MRKLFSLVAVTALLPGLVACGSGDDKSGGTDFGKAGVKVTEDFGKKPTITHRDGEPDKSLVTEVLKEGGGAEVKKGELLTAHYIGQIWRDGKVFDNSYDRGAPTSFPIGVGGVVAGWDEGLVGKKLGSRVLLSIPPDKGYKSEGNKQAGIEGTDTLIFVVDLVSSAGNETPLDATPQKIPADGPQVAGELNAEPKVTLPKGIKPPAKPGPAVIVAKGKGKPVEKGSQIVGRYVIYDYKGKKVFSTWTMAAQQGQQPGPTDKLQTGATPNPQKNPLDALIGIPLGSRVLLEIPPQKDQKGKTMYAFAVLDVINSFPAGKSQ